MKVDKQKIIEACNNSLSMTQAAAKVCLNFKTFKKYAEKLGVWKTNAAGVGLKKTKGEGKGGFSLASILEGNHPQYSSHKLRKRLIAEGLKEDKCEECHIGNEYNGKPLSMHLDHIDGNHYNHVLENLRILCPNCHSQTETYGSKK